MVSKNNNQIYRARQNDQKRGQHTYKSEYMKMNRYFQEIKIYFERWVCLFKETGTFNKKLKKYYGEQRKEDFPVPATSWPS